MVASVLACIGLAERVTTDGDAGKQRSSMSEPFLWDHENGFLQLSSSSGGPPWPYQIAAKYKKVKYLTKDPFTEDYLIEDLETGTQAVLKLVKMGSTWIQDYHLDIGFHNLRKADSWNSQVYSVCSRARMLTKTDGAGRSRWMMCFEEGDGDPTNNYIVTEYLGKTDLRKWQNEHKGLPPVADMTRIVKMLLEAVASIQGTWTHRNIRDTNIMMLEKSGQLYLKIGDLMAMSRDGIYRSSDNNFAGSHFNQPPETLGYLYNPSKINYEVAHSIDIYSIGMVIFRMLCATKAQRNDDSWGVNTLVEQLYGHGNKFKFRTYDKHDGEIQEANDRLLQAFSVYVNNEGPWKYCVAQGTVPEEYKPLLLIMALMMNAKENRPGAAELLQDPIFAEVNTDNADIAADVTWVADHMEEQIQFETKHKAKVESKAKKLKVRRKTPGMPNGEMTFHKTELQALRTWSQNNDLNPLHILQK